MTEPIAVPVCPTCGAAMVMRHRRSDGAPFWGCSRFPECHTILKVAFTGANRPTANPAPPPFAPPTAWIERPKPLGPSAQSGSLFHRPGWIVLVCDMVAAACAMAILAPANGGWTYLFLGGTLLAITALSIVSATFTSPAVAISIAWRVMVVALVGVFGTFGLVPISMWLGQIIGNEMIRAIPTLPHHTPSMLP